MKGRELVVGVTGGIAAYKTAALVSRMVQEGAGVTVVMTAAARQFIGPATFAALTGRPVLEHTFDERDHPLGAHIEMAERADLLCVAPATANFLAKAAAGMADDLLTTLLLAFTKPVLLAPAMNSEMWQKAAVARNVAQLKRDGYEIIDPEEGWLSCRRTGPGRMASPDHVYDAIATRLSQVK